MKNYFRIRACYSLKILIRCGFRPLQLLWRVPSERPPYCEIVRVVAMQRADTPNCKDGS